MTDGREEARAAARELLVQHLFAAVKTASEASPTPELVIAAAPMTFAGAAGSYVLQLLRARVLNDGEVDKVLGDMAATMREHADPSLPGNNSESATLTPDAKSFLRRLFGRE